MLDLAVRGGTVVDGTAGPRRRADVGIRDGRIVAVGELDEQAARTMDAEGLVVAPGFVDIHTHYDAQVFWDPGLTPSSVHGVTTVVAGNCGFTLAPMQPEHTDYITKMLAMVEGMPLEALLASVPYDWASFGEFLDRVDGLTSLNIGFMVGHSTIRRQVMGPDAVGGKATSTQIDAMCQLLAESLSVGGLGFSSSRSAFHNDGGGNPVPSRAASDDELVALCAIAGQYEGTSLEFIPSKHGPLHEVEANGFDLMAKMSAAANRAINWNVLQANAQHPDVTMGMVKAGKAAGAQGARIVPLTSCDVMRLYVSFKTGLFLAPIPGWAATMVLPFEEKLRALQDPQVRAQLIEGSSQWQWDWAEMRVIQTSAPENARYEGRAVGEIAQERHCRPVEAVLDLVIADRLETVFLLSPRSGMGEEEEAWKLRGELWRDPQVVVGASDAGAHLDLNTSFTFGTSVLQAARKHHLMSLEEAIHILTDRPAQLYGIRDRGRIEVGAHADVLLFEEERIGVGSVYWRDDLPAGAGRLYADPVGIHNVVVSGREIVSDNTLTGDTPGTVLRSGRDTRTPGAP